ncbi:MAG: PilZ domain-containing protein, partial [Deltaproteobacteria bacterium]|nr:PilZ domain-containing protein [Deltaproteobacteria bacterium]
MQTSIDTTRERRKSLSPRIPVDLLVELCATDERDKGERALDSWSDVSDAFTDSYDADGLDLSATGLRLRSSVLPDVGQRLRCRFDLPDTEGKCEAEGRVVWSNDAGRHGEFGLRFDSLSASVESALARWAMDRGPSTLPGSEPAPEAPIVIAPAKETAKKIVAPRIETPKVLAASPSPAFGLARVRFDGVSSAIEAEVSLRDESRMDVEQALPFFELGRLASVDADGSTERRRLEHVSLKIENGVPKLVLGFVAAPSSSAGTLSAPSFDDEVETSAERTMQDESIETIGASMAREPIEETREARASEQEAIEERVVEARASSSGAWVTDEGSIDEADDDELATEREPVKQTRAERERATSKRALFGGTEDSIDDADPQIEAQRRKKLDEVRRVLLDGDELPEAPASSAGQQEAARPAALEVVKIKARALSSSMATSMGPALSRLVAAMRTGWTSFVAAVGPRTKSAYAAVAAWVVRVASLVSERIKDRAPRLGALLTRGSAKEKRRTTTPSSAQAPHAAPRRQ